MQEQKAILDQLTLDSKEFIPAKWAKNPHLQTILPRIIHTKPAFAPIWQRILTPDNDFLDLCWTEPPTQLQRMDL